MAFNQVHALLIGVNKYRYAPRLDIPVASQDTDAVVKNLSDPRYCGYPADQTKILSDMAAIRLISWKYSSPSQSVDIEEFSPSWNSYITNSEKLNLRIRSALWLKMRSPASKPSLRMMNPAYRSSIQRLSA